MISKTANSMMLGGNRLRKFPHVESCIYTQFYLSSVFLSWGTWVQSPGGYLFETGILLLAVSRYIGDPDMIDHCGLVWGGLCPDASLGLHATNVIIPLDFSQLFCPGFMLAVGPSSGFTTDIVGCLGEPVQSLQSHCIYTQFHWSTHLLPVMRDLGLVPRGVLMWNQDSPVSVVSLQPCHWWVVCSCVHNLTVHSVQNKYQQSTVCRTWKTYLYKNITLVTHAREHFCHTTFWQGVQYYINRGRQSCSKIVMVLYIIAFSLFSQRKVKKR